jgi:hypothetical protein
MIAAVVPGIRPVGAGIRDHEHYRNDLQALYFVGRGVDDQLELRAAQRLEEIGNRRPGPRDHHSGHTAAKVPARSGAKRMRTAAVPQAALSGSRPRGPCGDKDLFVAAASRPRHDAYRQRRRKTDRRRAGIPLHGPGIKYTIDGRNVSPTLLHITGQTTVDVAHPRPTRNRRRTPWGRCRRERRKSPRSESS